MRSREESSDLRARDRSLAKGQASISWFGLRDSAMFPEVTVTNYHKLGSLMQQNFIVIVVEVRRPKSRC